MCNRRVSKTGQLCAPPMAAAQRTVWPSVTRRLNFLPNLGTSTSTFNAWHLSYFTHGQIMASGHHCYSKQFKKRHKQKSNIASTRRQGGVRSIILERGHLAPHSASPAQKKKKKKNIYKITWIQKYY